MMTWAIAWMVVSCRESEDFGLVIGASLLLGALAVFGDIIIFTELVEHLL